MGPYRALSGVSGQDANVLVCSASEPVACVLRDLLEPQSRVKVARTCRQAYRLLCKDRFDAVLCAAHLPDGDWQDILGVVATMPDPASVIVLSENDDSLWGEVSAMGGYDVLPVPPNQAEVNSLIDAACRQSRRARKPAALVMTASSAVA